LVPWLAYWEVRTMLEYAVGELKWSKAAPYWSGASVEITVETGERRAES
jgi:hypothetical protein